jgi:hypothetical protein
VLFWSSMADYSFYQSNVDIGGTCFNSEAFSTRSLHQPYAHMAALGNMSPIPHNKERIVYSQWEPVVEPLVRILSEPIAAVHRSVPSPCLHHAVTAAKDKRSSIPYLPGTLFCSAESQDLGQLTSGGQGEYLPSSPELH